MDKITCGFAGRALQCKFTRRGQTVDLSGAETLTIRIYKPNGDTVDKVASIVSGTTDTIEVLTVATDTQDGSGAPLRGRYRYRARVAQSSSSLDGWTANEGFFEAEEVR